MRSRAQHNGRQPDEVECFERRQSVIDALKVAVGVEDQPHAAVIHRTVPRISMAAVWALILLIVLVSVLVELLSP